MELIARSNAGIEAGINDDGDLFLGDDKSGYNLPLTRKNVDRVVSDFNRYLDKDETKLTADAFKEYIQDDEDEEVEESINIRESLLNIDKDTDNEYDLCTLYESLQLSDNEKRDVVKMLTSKTSPSDIYECLNNKLVNETWSYKGTENNNMKTVNEAKRRAHVFDDLVDEITTRLANKGMRSDTDKYLGIYDETTSSDDADGKFRMEIGELKFDYDKKTGDHVIIVQPEEGSPRDLSFARSIAREYAQEGVRVEEKKHNGKDAIFFYIPEDAEPFDHPAPEFKGRGEYLKKVTPWIENKEYVELEKQYNDKLIDIFKEEGWEDPQRVVDGDKVSITFKDDDGYVYDYTTDHKSELIDLYKKQNKIDDFARYMYEVAFEQADMKEPEEVMKESLNQYKLTDKVTEYVDDDDVIAYEKIARVLRTNLDNLYVVEDDSYDYDPQFLDRSGRRVAGIEAFKYEVNGIPVVRERASGGLRMYFRNSDDADKYVEYVKEENGLDESVVSSNWRSDDDPEDETTYNYDDELVMDLDDDAVQAGETFIEDGREWQWIKQIGDVEHIDFDNWAVWFATDVDTQDGGYFIVDIDTGFIDWGPVDTEEEATDFLDSKKYDDEDDDDKLESISPADLLELKSVSYQGLKDKLTKELNKVMKSPEFGFDDDEIKEYSGVEVKEDKGQVYVSVWAEVGYDALWTIKDALDPIIAKYDKDAYFDMEDAGRLLAVISDSKLKESLSEDYSDEEKTHPYVGKKIRVKGSDTDLNGRVFTVTRAFDDSRGTSVRVDFNDGHQTLTLSPDQYKLIKESGNSFKSHHICRDSVEESLNLNSEGKRLKKAISQLVLDSDEELRDYVNKIIDEVVEERNDDTEDESLADSVDTDSSELNEDIDLSSYEEVDGGSGCWTLYRKFKPGMKKAEWAAKNQNTGEIRKISYKQATGEEPIEDSPIKRLERDVGKKLLPSKLEAIEDLSKEQVNTLKEMGSMIVSDIEKEAKELQRSFIALNRCLQRANVPVTNIEETIMYQLSELLKNSSDDTVTVSDLKEYVNKIQ